MTTKTVSMKVPVAVNVFATIYGVPGKEYTKYGYSVTVMDRCIAQSTERYDTEVAAFRAARTDIREIQKNSIKQAGCVRLGTIGRE